jgi:hypothetical protein
MKAEDVIGQVMAIRDISTEKNGDEPQGSFRCSDDPKLALKEITLVQKQLCAIKSQLAATMKEITPEYQENVQDSTYRPLLGGMLPRKMWRQTMRTRGAAEGSPAQQPRQSTCAL